MDSQTMNVAIGKRVTEIRKSVAEKQETTAKYLNMTRPNYSKKESGMTAFSPYELAELSKHFDVDCHYLITGIKAAHYDMHEETGLSDMAIDRLRRLSYNTAQGASEKEIFQESKSELAAKTNLSTVANLAAIMDAFLCADKLPQLLSSIAMYIKSSKAVLSDSMCKEFLRPDNLSVIEKMQKNGFGILWPGSDVAAHIWLEESKDVFTQIIKNDIAKRKEAADDGEH